jgi:hypothetical protein
MSEFSITIEGMRQLEAAIRRNPAKIREEVGKLLVRGIAEYKKVMFRSPWKVGGYGGGVPVDTTAMRQQHQTRFERFRASIGPNLRATPYALFVHEGTHKMQGRPWLDYAKKKADRNIRKLSQDFLDNVVKDLAR